MLKLKRAFRKLQAKLHGGWELIGYSLEGYDWIKEDLRDVPKWVQKVAFTYDDFGAYYIKGKTFIYKVIVEPGYGQGYRNYYFYRKLRRKS